MQVQNVNNSNVSFKGVIFKNKAIYAKYGNGIVGKIRNNVIVESFKYRKDYDMVFSADASKDIASFYWQVKKRNVSDAFELLKNLLAPKVHFESSVRATKPSANEITAQKVGEYIAKHLL